MLFVPASRAITPASGSSLCDAEMVGALAVESVVTLRLATIVFLKEVPVVTGTNVSNN
jgi:hypothetical protein